MLATSAPVLSAVTFTVPWASPATVINGVTVTGLPEVASVLVEMTNWGWPIKPPVPGPAKVIVKPAVKSPVTVQPEQNGNAWMAVWRSAAIILNASTPLSPPLIVTCQLPASGTVPKEMVWMQFCPATSVTSVSVVKIAVGWLMTANWVVVAGINVPTVPKRFTEAMVEGSAWNLLMAFNAPMLSSETPKAVSG